MNTTNTLATLTDEDVSMFYRLGITSDTLAAAQIQRVSDSEAHEFGIVHSGDCTGLIFPYMVKGQRTTARLRRDRPEIVEGKPSGKYLCPLGDRRHLYLPPDYEQLLAEPSMLPLVFVEAEKSVLAVWEWSRRTGRRVLPIGTGGCWGWRGRNGTRTTANGKREEERGPLPEVSYAKGRGCAVLFDANAATKPDVQKARKAFVQELNRQGAVGVIVIDLPALEGVNGVDDFIGIAGDEAFGQLLDGKYKNSTNQPANSATVETVPVWLRDGSTATAEPAPDLLPYGFHDSGNAERLIKLHGAHLLYSPHMRKWLHWDGRRWKIDELEQITRLGQETIQLFAHQAVGDKWAMMHSIRSFGASRIRAMIELAEPYKAIEVEKLDTDPQLMNFLNGTFNYETGQLQPHSPKNLITKIVKHNYVPDAKCPTFLTFLKKILDPLVIPYLQVALGYSITGVTIEKKAMLALGPTDSGKTTLLALVYDVFEEYAAKLMIDSLMTRYEDNNSHSDLADLRGARFVMTSETKEGQRLNEEKLKRLTQGQGKFKVVRKYELPHLINETYHIWIDANHKPDVRGTDNAIWNRLVPIPFEKQLKPEEIDIQLPAKLREEAAGIIAWIIQGALDWKKNGLGTPPEQVQRAKSNWRDETDRLANWRSECCTLHAELESPASALYENYCEWSEKNRERPLSNTAFGLRSAEAGFKKRRTSDGIFYAGLALKSFGRLPE
jgi:putative DNA primase/helicase